MKFIFSLAIIANKDQKIEELLRPYIREKLQ